jgi:hypothetical protein
MIEAVQMLRTAPFFYEAASLLQTMGRTPKFRNTLKPSAPRSMLISQKSNFCLPDANMEIRGEREINV